MNSPSFKNFVPKLFLSAEEQEIRALEKIERQRQEREHEKRIALTSADLQDRVDAARENFSNQCRTLDEASEFSPEQFTQLFLNGHKLEDLALRLAGTEKLKQNMPRIRAELERLIVGTAEKSLADFQKANRDVLAKLPKLERAAEPVFVAAELPPNHYTDGAAAKLAAKSIQ